MSHLHLSQRLANHVESNYIYENSTILVWRKRKDNLGIEILTGIEYENGTLSLFDSARKMRDTSSLDTAIRGFNEKTLNVCQSHKLQSMIQNQFNHNLDRKMFVQNKSIVYFFNFMFEECFDNFNIISRFNKCRKKLISEMNLKCNSNDSSRWKRSNNSDSAISCNIKHNYKDRNKDSILFNQKNTVVAYETEITSIHWISFDKIQDCIENCAMDNYSYTIAVDNYGGIKLRDSMIIVLTHANHAVLNYLKQLNKQRKQHQHLNYNTKNQLNQLNTRLNNSNNIDNYNYGLCNHSNNNHEQVGAASSLNFIKIEFCYDVYVYVHIQQLNLHEQKSIKLNLFELNKFDALYNCIWNNFGYLIGKSFKIIYNKYEIQNNQDLKHIKQQIKGFVAKSKRKYIDIVLDVIPANNKTTKKQKQAKIPNWKISNTNTRHQQQTTETFPEKRYIHDQCLSNTSDHSKGRNAYIDSKRNKNLKTIESNGDVYDNSDEFIKYLFKKKKNAKQDFNVVGMYNCSDNKNTKSNMIHHSNHSNHNNKKNNNVNDGKYGRNNKNASQWQESKQQQLDNNCNIIGNKCFVSEKNYQSMVCTVCSI